MRLLDPEKLLQEYERGNITRMELRIHLIQTATQRVPDKLAATLPQDLIDELHEESRILPQNPDERRVLGIGMSMEDIREATHLYHEGLRLWHRYFNHY
jgi:hypothetical protein